MKIFIFFILIIFTPSCSTHFSKTGHPLGVIKINSNNIASDVNNIFYDCVVNDSYSRNFVNPIFGKAYVDGKYYMRDIVLHRIPRKSVMLVYGVGSLGNPYSEGDRRSSVMREIEKRSHYPYFDQFISYNGIPPKIGLYEMYRVSYGLSSDEVRIISELGLIEINENGHIKNMTLYNLGFQGKMNLLGHIKRIRECMDQRIN